MGGMRGTQGPRRLAYQGDGLDCLVYLPEGYAGGADEAWPLVFFLHGAGERGRDLERLKAHGIPRVVEEEGRRFPFVAVSPQCPPNRYWTELTPTLVHVLDAALVELRVEPASVHLTGMSMGGFGAWKLAAEAPERFTTLAPICGGGDPAWAKRLCHLPTWAFHGEKDDVVPVESTLRMVRALQAVRAPVKVTIYPDVGHDSWTRTYANPALYDWFFRRGAIAHESISL
jgi:predicted peptidase